jgi:hypothetical protein
MGSKPPRGSSPGCSACYASSSPWRASGELEQTDTERNCTRLPAPLHLETATARHQSTGPRNRSRAVALPQSTAPPSPFSYSTARPRPSPPFPEPRPVDPSQPNPRACALCTSADPLHPLCSTPAPFLQLPGLPRPERCSAETLELLSPAPLLLRNTSASGFLTPRPPPASHSTRAAPPAEAEPGDRLCSCTSLVIGSELSASSCAPTRSFVVGAENGKGRRCCLEVP